MKKYLFFLFFLICASHAGYADTLSFSTYYPAPHGAYSKLRLVPQAPLAGACQTGEMYVDSNNNLFFCQVDKSWGYPSGVWRQSVDTKGFPIVHLSDNDSDLFVGIGDQEPDGILEISASGTSNDLLVLSKDDNSNGNLMIVKSSGNIGIGKTNPTSILDVRGNVNISNGLNVGQGITVGNTNNPVPGTIRWNGTAFQGFDGTDWLSFSGSTSSGGGGSQIFLTSGNFTVPSGINVVFVTSIGGGGGGGGGGSGGFENGGGGGGAAGGQVINLAPVTVTPKTTYTITVGSGGSGGNGGVGPYNQPGSNGQAGGDTSFGTLLVACGGGGGGKAPGQNSGGPGGAKSTCNGSGVSGEWGIAGGQANNLNSGKGGKGGNANNATGGSGGSAGSSPPECASANNTYYYGKGGNGGDGSGPFGAGGGGGGGGGGKNNVTYQYAVFCHGAGGNGGVGNPGMLMVSW
ncbi:MAG TPA: hypothetical protein DD723_07660 [Candidatus Omnitrophica bacterium]|nr:MAG: hypothetical protein A2Z81_04350 [Omnitrophica WOR_2 bacterium GWA2_45_18]HBR15402.1 hypothetical protein [Candidatus Omnitrophota bacterium]